MRKTLVITLAGVLMAFVISPGTGRMLGQTPQEQPGSARGLQPGPPLVPLDE
jgi:hypothetical protein